MFYFIIFLKVVITYSNIVLIEHLNNRLSREYLSRYMVLSIIPVLNIISFIIIIKYFIFNNSKGE